MKTLLALFLSTSLLFAENENVALAEVPTFTSPSIPELQGTQLAPVLPKSHKSAFATVGLACLAPGLGHVYLSDLQTATALFGTATLSRAFSKYYSTEAVANLASYQNTWMYNIYAAYRDVRINNNQTGYKYRMPNDSFEQLATASFQWRVLAKPEVWGGFIGAITAGTLIDRFISKGESSCKIDTSRALYPLCAFSVGVGEEAFFRGYLQSFCAERMDPASAIAVSSAIFGAAHIVNILRVDETGTIVYSSDSREYLTYWIPFITAFGAYFGWLAHKSRSLKEGVALHAWYDFAVFLETAVTKAAIPMVTGGDPQFALSFNF